MDNIHVIKEATLTVENNLCSGPYITWFDTLTNQDYVEEDIK